MKRFDVAIIGGGISGLHTAFELSKKGVSFKLFEARSRLGGRIYSPSSQGGVSGFDVGPSWFWPGQAHIEQLVVELGLQHKVFEQFHQGDALYEPVGSEVLRGMGGISMQGSYRMQGGLKIIIDELYVRISELAGVDSLSVGSKVSHVELKGACAIDITLEDGEIFGVKKTVLAMPPRVALNEIKLTPNLPQARVNELNKVATWMAGHAKMVAIYDEAFWREEGLSGDVISQVGPLSEVHDASPANASVFSLFGFFSTPPQFRGTDQGEINEKIIEQLTRLFGHKASSPVEIIYKDWAKDALTATKRDQLIPNHHPSNEWSTKVEESFNGCLIWSGTESAKSHYNGYVEGAIIASHLTLSLL